MSCTLRVSKTCPPRFYKSEPCDALFLQGWISQRPWVKERDEEERQTTPLQRPGADREVASEAASGQTNGSVGHQEARPASRTTRSLARLTPCPLCSGESQGQVSQRQLRMPTALPSDIDWPFLAKMHKRIPELDQKKKTGSNDEWLLERALRLECARPPAPSPRTLCGWRPFFTELRPNQSRSPNFGRILAQTDLPSVASGRVWAKLDRIGSTLFHRFSLDCVDFGQSWAKFGRSRSNLARSLPKARCWPSLGCFPPHERQTRPDVVGNSQSSGRCRAGLLQIRPAMCQRVANLETRWPHMHRRPLGRRRESYSGADP